MPTPVFGFTDTELARQVEAALLAIGPGHIHNGQLGNALDSVDPPELEILAGDGALDGGDTYYYGIATVDEQGRESVLSVAPQVTLPAPIENPGPPSLDTDTTGGFFPPSPRSYILTAYVNDNPLQQTLPSAAQDITVPAGTSTNTITVTFPPLPDGATGWNIWRYDPGAPDYGYVTYVDMTGVTPPTEFVDTGLVPADCTRGLPASNSTASSYRVKITYPGGVVPEGHTWRIYRTIFPSRDAMVWQQTLVWHVQEETEEASGIISPEYIDDGGQLLAFSPVLTGVGQVQNPGKIDINEHTTGTLDPARGGGSGALNVVALVGDDADLLETGGPLEEITIVNVGGQTINLEGEDLALPRAGLAGQKIIRLPDYDSVGTGDPPIEDEDLRLEIWTITETGPLTFDRNLNAGEQVLVAVLVLLGETQGQAVGSDAFLTAFAYPSEDPLVDMFAGPAYSLVPATREASTGIRLNPPDLYVAALDDDPTLLEATGVTTWNDDESWAAVGLGGEVYRLGTGTTLGGVLVAGLSIGAFIVIDADPNVDPRAGLWQAVAYDNELGDTVAFVRPVQWSLYLTGYVSSDLATDVGRSFALHPIAGLTFTVTQGDHADEVWRTGQISGVWSFDPTPQPGVGDLSDRVTTAESDIDDLETALGALDSRVDDAETDIAGLVSDLAGKADLSGGKVPLAQLPGAAIGERFPVDDEAEMLALTAQIGDVAIRADEGNRVYWLVDTDPSVLASWLPILAADGTYTAVEVDALLDALAIADIDGLVAALAAKADATRAINAGTGLTGGGTLAADRTLAVDFGTGAGKVVEGNHAGLTDQRTPTDGSVTTAKFAAAAIDPVAGTAGARTLGTGAQQAAAGNDSRFADAAALTTGTLPAGRLARTPNAQTGTTYTLVAGDAELLVTLTNASAITLTIPLNASVAFPLGTRIDIAQGGAGQVTVADGGGITLKRTPTNKLRALDSGATLVKTDTDTWRLFGDLAAS